MNLLQAARRRFLVAALLCLGTLGAWGESAQEAHARLYAEARKAWSADPSNPAAVIQFGRASFDHADFATGNPQRGGIAEEAIGTLKALLGREPKSGPAHYWLAMNLGQLARTKTLGALKLVREMEKEFLAAREFDKLQDFGGPDRNLGQLYFQAPGWPTSIGNRKKARVHVEEAAKLFPDYPGNQVALLDIATDAHDLKTAQEQIKALAEGRSRAREKFSGPEWQDEWHAWDSLRDRCRRKIDELRKARSTGSKP